MPLVMTKVDVQLTVPGGTVTVSPLEALAIAAFIALTVAAAAGQVAATRVDWLINILKNMNNRAVMNLID